MTHVWQSLVRTAAIAAALIAAMGCADTGASSKSDDKRSFIAPTSTRDITFTTPDGLIFRGVIEAPPLHARNGWGVLMIGGGFGNDLDWTVPGAIGEGEERVQMTISGESHADGPAISAVLASRGFTVMRWSTIAVDDPLADEWPMRATPHTLGQLLEQTRFALGALRAVSTIESEQIILLGHSLGAARACTIASEDHGVQGLMLLAPAYFTRPPSRQARFEAEGMRYGQDVLQFRSIPCLAVFGARDSSRAVDAGSAQQLAEDGTIAGLTVRLMPGLGHQLGPFEDGRHGPVDAEVLQALGDWAVDVAKER